MQIKFKVFRLVSQTKTVHGWNSYDEIVSFKLVDPGWWCSEFTSELEAENTIEGSGKDGETYVIQKTYYIPESWQK